MNYRLKFLMAWRSALLVVAMLLPVSASTVSAQLQILPEAARIISESVPLDDEVLATSPQRLDLNFQSRVRLVKLVLYNEKHDWVDLNFRYDPRPGMRFSWPVPLLQPAEFYTAEWAVLSSDEQLWRGSFSFSFGPDAEAPSAVQERLRMMLQWRNDLPVIRDLQELGKDPAEIIINRQSLPNFLPPFAPVLD